MDNIAETIRLLNANGKRAFIPYITAGDPDIEKTYEALKILAGCGADIIEVGVPFSDPMADGPVIQRAMERAIKRGIAIRDILEVVRVFKGHYRVPIVLMGYFNPFYAYGLERFAEDARSAGIDAVLTVDLPPEEAGEFKAILDKRGITSIFLATPVTDKARMRIIKKVADGFIYFVSVTGITGERETISFDITERIEEVRRIIGLPVVLGFGISGPDIIKGFLPTVDGFVVGSAIVKRWEEASSSEDALSAFKGFLKGLADACHLNA